MSRVSRWGAAFLAVVLGGLCTLVVIASSADAAEEKPFTIRYQSNDTGDILLRGNSLLTCPTAATNCAAAKDLSATPIGGLNNDAYSMEFANTDTDPATNSSSDADLVLPAGASVKFAGLYWSAYTGGSGGSPSVARTPPPGSTAKNRLLLKAPNDTAYRTITAAAGDVFDSTGSSTGLPYVSFADVTNIVQAGGSGTYTGADIHAATGFGSYAAWSLVVVIRQPSLPQRRLVVFDGFGTVQNTPTSDRTINVTLNGLSTSSSGQVDVRLGAVVFEGDAGLTGDQFQLSSSGGPTTLLSNTPNPQTNVFNSTVSDAGVNVAGRSPTGNTFGLDADVFEASALLGNNTTSATLTMNTGGETYFPAVATFVSNIYAPRLDVTRSAAVADTVADSRTRPGDRITYTIDVANSGSTDSLDTRIADAIPAGTTYVPNSLFVGNTQLTDATGDDAGEISGTTLNVRLGTGASSSAGGTLAPAGTTRIRYTVEITGPFTAGGTVSATSAVTYADASPRTFDTTSNTSSTTVDPARADLRVTQVPSPAVVQAPGPNAASWAATVTNNGPDAEPSPVLVETLPVGVTGVSFAGASCTIVGASYRCPLPALASGASTTVTFNATLPAGTADPAGAAANVSGAATDPSPGNNTDTTSVRVNSAPNAVDDAAALNSPAFSTDIDVLVNDTDPNSGDTLTISAPSTPAHGTTSIVSGRVRYTLTDPNFVGTDTFTYTACDGRGGCDTATVNVAVNDHRRADLKVTHTAAPKNVQRGGNLSVTWTAVVTNDGPQSVAAPKLVETLPTGVTGLGVEGGTCTITGTTYTCTLGALASGASTTVRFTATLPAAAADPSTATATVSDGAATNPVPDPDLANNTAAAPVGVNRGPTATADTASLPADVLSVDIDARANDQDPDSDPLTISTVAKPAHGTAAIVAGKIRYTLTDPTFSSNETFTYTVCDSRGGCSDATVTVAVADHEVADLVVTQTATPKVLQRDGTRVGTWTVTVKNNGPEGATQPVLTQTFPAGATAITSSLSACTISGVVATCPMTTLANGASAEITFTATLPADAGDPSGAQASVTSGSTDPDLTSNKASASVALNTAPVADAEEVTLSSSVLKVTIDALAGDTDADKDPLTLRSVGKPNHGTATIANGKISYELTDTSFVGDDTFSYTVCDDRSGCATAEVTVKVADHRHAPVAAADKASVAAGASVRIDVLANDQDQDGGTLKLSRITRQPANGTVKIVDGNLIYTPDAGFVGTDKVGYEVCDSNKLCSTATATVQVTSAPPGLTPDTGTVRPGGTSVFNVLGNDDPGDYPSGSVTILGQPAVGTVTVGKDNTIRYQAPKSAKPGTKVSIRYRVCNKSGACSTETLQLTVAGEPVKGGVLAYTGTRFVAPLTAVALVLMAGGLMSRALAARGLMPQVLPFRRPSRRRTLPRGRHKA